jgi:predicted RNA-binding Zn-ribbon protein involved in translation (DUF1610 family)
MDNFTGNICPQCGNEKLKSWHDLSADEQILIERLPASAEFSQTERKRHSWCPRCWYEFIHRVDKRV